MPYDMPGKLREAIQAFIEYYNYQCYHEGLGNATPYVFYIGRHLEIVTGKEAKNKTSLTGREYNGAVKEHNSG